MSSGADFGFAPVSVPDLADIEADYAARENGRVLHAAADDPAPLPAFDYSARPADLPEREPAAAIDDGKAQSPKTPANGQPCTTHLSPDAQAASARATVHRVHSSDRLSLRGLDTYRIRKVAWLDKPFLQRGAFHLLGGRKGVCKGTWLCGVAARVTSGDLYGEPKRVLVITSEDSIELDFKPRLLAAGGNPGMVEIVNGSFRLPDDIPWLKAQALKLGNTGLIAVDPLGNHTGGKDTNAEGDIRTAIQDLNPLADTLDCMVFGVRHLGKDSSRGALASVLGSTAFVDVPRAVLLMAADDEDEMLFHAQVVAGNRGPRSNTGRAYRLELRDVAPATEITCLVPEGESTKDVEALLGAKTGTEPESKSGKARELILDILDAEGPQESDALDARVVGETGISAKTVRNLRGGLGKEGLIKAHPQLKNEDGTVARWGVARTLAPRENT